MCVAVSNMSQYQVYKLLKSVKRRFSRYLDSIPRYYLAVFLNTDVFERISWVLESCNVLQIIDIYDLLEHRVICLFHCFWSWFVIKIMKTFQELPHSLIQCNSSHPQTVAKYFFGPQKFFWDSNQNAKLFKNLQLDLRR